MKTFLVTQTKLLVLSSPPSYHNRYAILDSGATGSFVTSSDQSLLKNVAPTITAPTILAANGTIMPARSHGQLQLSPDLTAPAQHAFVLDDLQTGTLISLGQLCDDNCIALFTRYGVKILKNNQVIITGKREPNGLWSIPLTPQPSLQATDFPLTPPPLQANGILRLDKTKQQLAMYHHAALGSPSTSTLLRAIRLGHLLTFPGLTTQLISKHLPQSIATALGHQDQEAKNLRSTQPTTPAISTPDDDLSPKIESRSHTICTMLVPTKTILKSYSDQTGKFPTVSSRGHHYIFVFYNYDTNSIHATAIPNRQAASIHTAWVNTYKQLLNHGHTTDLHIIDNECSQDLKDAFAKYNVPFQRVPPKEHRANSAERAIRTFKNHLVSILASVDTNYPLTEWDRLLPQAVLTLNLLRSSRIHPSLSAHASIFGAYDYNRTPIAPPGTKVVAHTSSDARTTFGPHGRVGWYIGPSMQHYRCFKVYFTDTYSEIDVLKVNFFPQQVPFPLTTTNDYLRQTAEDMLALLRVSAPKNSINPLAFGPPILNAFGQVAEILGRAVSNPATLLPTGKPSSNIPVSSPRVPLFRPAPPRVPTVTPPPHRFHQQPLLCSPEYDDVPPPRVHTLNSAHHDPTISGKMYNPVTGRAETIDSLLVGPDSSIWTTSLTNELGRCSQGISKSRSAATKIAGTQTIFFIKPNQVPAGRKVTYANFVCTMRPNKSEVYRIRMTVGGDRLDAYQDVRSPAVGITDTKIHLNSTISDAHKGARYCTADLKDFFLNSTMHVYQYMRLHRRYVTKEILDEYAMTDDFFLTKKATSI